MKIHIWINNSEAISGKITKWYIFGPPQSSNWTDYVQVSISQDEFARLEDKAVQYSASIDGPGQKLETGRSTKNYTYPEFVEKHYKPERGEDWLVEQYNRNRNQEDWVETRDEIPYIYERDGEDVYRRRSGDTPENRELITNDEFHASKKPIKKDLKKLLQELQTISGAKFADWWKGLTKEEQIELTKFWE